MRIGIDIDDTICDSFEQLLPLICDECNLDINKLRNENISYEYFFKDKTSDLFKGATKILFENVDNIPLKENVAYYINLLHEEGNEIIFITSRSNHTFSDPYKTTRDYLEKNNIYYDKLIVSSHTKDNICVEEKIDLFIDDSVDHTTSVNDKGIDVLLFDAGYNRHINKFTRVSSWEEVYNYIKTTTVK